MMITRHPRSFSGVSVPIIPAQMLFGYIPGNYVAKNNPHPGAYSAFAGLIDRNQVESSGSPTASPNEIGYDFTFQAPAGLKIEKVEVWGSNDNGYVFGGNPIDTKIALLLYDGIFNDVGDTGEFTDGSSANKKTITSTDQTTLFTRFKVKITYTGALSARFAAIKLFEVGGGEISFPLLSTDTPVRVNATNGRGEQGVNGSGAALIADSLVSIASDASDYDIIIEFDKARPVNKIEIFGASNGGLINGSNPIDVQIDLFGFDGSFNFLGDSGTFEDADSISKEVSSSDNTTLFTKIKIKISTATSAFRLCSDLQVHVFI